MNILFLTTVARTVRAFLLPFGLELRKRGASVSAAAAGVSTCPACQESFDETLDISWSRNPLNLKGALHSTCNIASLIRRGNFDIVHVHTPVAGFLTRWALRRRPVGKPVVVYTAHGFHFHSGGNPLTNWLFLGLEKLAGMWTDYLVVINREDEASARKHSLVPADRIIYMPGIGVDTTVYAPTNVPRSETSRVRSALALSETTPLLLMVAEFNPGKRHRDALHAFARIKCRKAHLAFAGDGRLQPKMRALAEELGVANRVHFLGLRSDIPALIRSSVATVLPSAREGLPRSIMESLSLGVPVIGTDIRGIRDLLQGQCGLLVPVGNPVALATAMDWVIEHPIEASEMGRRGRKKMAEQYDLRKIIRMHEELYARALGLSQPHRAALELADAV
jgi:glycosyltransferase involved in cell wall biosynthesis